MGINKSNGDFENNEHDDPRRTLNIITVNQTMSLYIFEAVGKL